MQIPVRLSGFNQHELIKSGTDISFAQTKLHQPYREREISITFLKYKITKGNRVEFI